MSALASGQGSPDVVISQVYGGGGNTGAPLRNDYVELFNRGKSAVDLTGWTIAYSSATGSAEQITSLSGSIRPGGYYLIWQSAGANVTLPEPPLADATGTAAMSATAGRVILRRSGTVADLVGYGTATLFEGAGPAPQLSNETAAARRRGGCADTDDNAADFQRVTPQPRNSHHEVAINCDAPGTAALPLRISDIQGRDETSPHVGRLVSTNGVVTGIRRDGFWIQSLPSDDDGNELTSDGLFVYTDRLPLGSLERRDVVRVTGTVAEFAPATDPTSPSLTELVDPTFEVVARRQELPGPVILTSELNLEQHEGMRVIASPVTVTSPTMATVQEPRNAATSSGVFYATLPPLPRPYLSADPEDDPGRIRVDTRAQGGFAVDVTSGVEVLNVVGPLDYAFRTYTIAQDADERLNLSGFRSAAFVPDPAPKELVLASMNLQRFFDTVDDPNTSDVVLTPEAFAMRVSKTGRVIGEMLRFPDIIAVQEVENIAVLRAIATAAGDYEAHLVEGNDIGGIDVGLLIKRSRVRAVEVFQEGRDFTTENGRLWDRPPLLARLQVENFAFTVMVVHPRSLIDATETRVAQQRQTQAEFIRQVATSRIVSGENVIVLGDFNIRQFDPLMTRIRSAGLINLTDTLSLSDNYSYLFEGATETLDHILISGGLRGLVVRHMFARLNADYPAAWRSDATRLERISDHDVPLLYLSLDPAALAVVPAGVTNAATYLSGAISPMQIVTIFGRGVTAGSQVFVNGSFATRLYSDDSQITAVTPASLQEGATATIEIETGGRRSLPVRMPVAATAPGIFVTSRRGDRGQGAILNEDSSANGVSNPAPSGSIIQIFGTGGGISPGNDTSVRIGGRQAQVLYAGPAPGQPVGVLQVNARIPAALPPGEAPIVLSVAGRPSALGVYVAVR